ncbi:DUF4291 domain-containing protein [Gluconobacter potus]|uniref:DUF4291 domain-containing protein n=1 Tax=Gluconobacter potus TaxID=2724927 RepID=UPI0012DADCAB|nr:DUF4291 domain-containing protein [Gluconobacter potus]
MENIQERQIRAVFDQKTTRVYQAYSDEIADAALSNGTFRPPTFKMERMTWIKPSFLWMMYRAGWGYKDAGQRRILAVDITRTGFEWALTNSCNTHRDHSISPEEWNRLKLKSSVRVQWDPERNLQLEPLPYRSLQIGLSKDAVSLYTGEWIQKITDMTDLAHDIHACVLSGDLENARKKLPKESVYGFSF